MTVLQLRQFARVFAALAAVSATVACGEVARTGRSPAYLIVDRLEGASGAVPNTFSTVVSSDVVTLVRRQINGAEVRVPTHFSDPGRVTFSLGLKNPGSAGSPTTPSVLNTITVTRYRVVYRRSDGRNTQGVDVPYAFDGGMTVTVPESSSVQGVFELVRVIAKDEPPLRNLTQGGGASAISTIAEISFFGYDQAGHEVTASGSITVGFADYGDPQ